MAIPIPVTETVVTIILIPAMDQAAFTIAVLPSGSEFTVVAATEADTMVDIAVGTEADTVAVTDIVAITITAITKVDAENPLRLVPTFSEIRLCFQGTEPFFLRGWEPDLPENCLISTGTDRQMDRFEPEKPSKSILWERFHSQNRG